MDGLGGGEAAQAVGTACRRLGWVCVPPGGLPEQAGVWRAAVSSEQLAASQYSPHEVTWLPPLSPLPSAVSLCRESDGTTPVDVLLFLSTCLQDYSSAPGGERLLAVRVPLLLHLPPPPPAVGAAVGAASQTDSVRCWLLVAPSLPSQLLRLQPVCPFDLTALHPHQHLPHPVLPPCAAPFSDYGLVAAMCAALGNLQYPGVSMLALSEAQPAAQQRC